jgi:CheY-like chemotaxis protein
VLDLLMPTMNGWDLVTRVREDTRLAQTPIVVVTATGPHWGYPVPASMVVRKPFQRQHLLRVIRQATGAVTPTPVPA